MIIMLNPTAVNQNVALDVVPRLKEYKFLKSADRSQGSSSRFLPWPHFQRWESLGDIFWRVVEPKQQRR